jgi:hypothetical protein
MPEAASATVIVYDLTGRIAASQAMHFIKGTNRVKLQTALPAGTYIIRITDGKASGVSKATLL